MTLKNSLCIDPSLTGLIHNVIYNSAAASFHNNHEYQNYNSK